MTDKYTPPRRASIKSVNNYLNCIEAGFQIWEDPANGWHISKYRVLQDGSSYDIGRTQYENARQFLDAFVSGYEA